MSRNEERIPVDPFSEYAMVCEDEYYPKTDFTQFQFKGAIDYAALSEAYDEALREVPIFSSHLIHGRKGLLFQPYWVPNLDIKNRLTIEDARHMVTEPYEPMEFSSRFHEIRTCRRIDLAHEFPFQSYLIRVGEDRHLFSVVYHHSCLDPAKFFIVFTKMLASYHEKVKGEKPNWMQSDGMGGLARTGKLVKPTSLYRYALNSVISPPCKIFEKKINAESD